MKVFLLASSLVFVFMQASGNPIVQAPSMKNENPKVGKALASHARKVVKMKGPIKMSMPRGSYGDRVVVSSPNCSFQAKVVQAKGSNQWVVIEKSDSNNCIK